MDDLFKFATKSLGALDDFVKSQIAEVVLQTMGDSIILGPNGTFKFDAKVFMTKMGENFDELKKGFNEGVEEFKKGVVPKRRRRPRLPDEKVWKGRGGRVTHHSDGSTTYIDWDVPPNTVKYSPEGFPDFDRYVHPDGGTVSINQTGDNSIDFPEANRKRQKSQPPGWSWHHHEDGTTMQLIPTEINSRFSHTGGASFSR